MNYLILNKCWNNLSKQEIVFKLLFLVICLPCEVSYLQHECFVSHSMPKVKNIYN